MNLDAMAGLQADELQKIIEGLQGLAAARQEPTQQPPVQTETALAKDDIQWEHMSTGRVQATADPHVRPPLTQTPVSTQPLTREILQSNNIPPPHVATFAELCRQQQRTESLAEYPAIFYLQESNITSTPERMDILASLPHPEIPALLIIVEQPTQHIRVLWGIEKPPYSYAKKTDLGPFWT